MSIFKPKDIEYFDTISRDAVLFRNLLEAFFEREENPSALTLANELGLSLAYMNNIFENRDIDPEIVFLIGTALQHIEDMWLRKGASGKFNPQLVKFNAQAYHGRRETSGTDAKQGTVNIVLSSPDKMNAIDMEAMKKIECIVEQENSLFRKE